MLLGAGHAHLHVLRHAAAIVARGHAVTVVAPPLFWYSGMATGMLGGSYAPAEHQVDAAALAREAGVQFLADEVTGLDPARRLVQLAGRPALPYDVLSVALGSTVAPLPAPDRFAAKPIRHLWALREWLQAEFAAGAAPRVLVVGGGMTACELAANVASLARRQGGTAVITVLAPAGGVLRQVRPAAAAAVLRALHRAGVTVRQDGPMLGATAITARIPGGEVGFDALVNATGLVAAPVLHRFGLPLGSGGGLLVDSRLRSVADPAVHGAGDCIEFADGKLPRAGVYAVRQAPVLLVNLLAALDGGTPRVFTPQRRYLWIMNLGDGTGLATYGRLHWHGRAALWLKDRIDRRFMARSRRALPRSRA